MQSEFQDTQGYAEKLRLEKKRENKFEDRWIELQTIILSEVPRPRKIKVACFLSFLGVS